MGREKHKYRARGASCCCGSRLSVSSSSSSSASTDQGFNNSEPRERTSEQREHSLSHLAHEMVQARLERMISGRRRGDRAGGHAQRGCKLVVLVARDRSSYNPRGDFRDSMLEVITSEGMKEPKELRTLLNCYMSLNPREHRQVILEAFHEVCSSLFPVFS